ncbi:46 kDa FK506-binding nuclear protein-like isoform X2 [Physella acuta]|uniref:46 kDa FK506-binding nuclear protein-like isoform X2 n=1 Tax=Physella acuta TaxID=109671 RepID=UPI0027DC6BDD|nr:46 kDa FK506-binding nuclear protein-like isoform X2 [Physella acuta]
MVVISDVNNMFWGVTLDGGKRYSQHVTKGFHISMAALEKDKPNENVQVMLQQESSEFLLCTLNSTILQQPLDLNFAHGENVTFSLNGSGVVHLTGYIIEEEPFDDSCCDSEEEAPSLVDTSAELSMSGGKKRKALESQRLAKKIKMLSDSVGDEDDDDDSEDADYSIDDEEEDEEFSDDFEEDEFGDSDSDDDDDDDDDEDESDEEEEESPKKKEKVKTPKPDSKNNTPVPQKSAQQKTPKKEESTPSQKATPKEAKKQKQSVSETPKTPKQNGKDESQVETPTTPAGESAKKKKKNKKKKNKDKSANNSMNESTASTPGNTSETTPSTPKKRVVAGGTVVEDLKVGHGPEAKPGKMVSVYYVGTLAKNNKRFDSCTDGKPFRFRLNQGEVIKGWDVGVNGMKVGGKRKITIPASQGYGNAKQGPIPPNSTLVFEVELKAVS